MLKEIKRPETLKEWNDYTNQTKTARAFARDLLPLLRFRDDTQPATPADVAALLHDVQTGRAHIREQKHTPRGLYVYTD